MLAQPHGSPGAKQLRNDFQEGAISAVGARRGCPRSAPHMCIFLEPPLRRGLLSKATACQSS